MKKLVFLVVIMAVIAMLMPVSVFAQEKDEAAAKIGKPLNADQVIARMETRKTKMLENIKLRFEKLNEKLATSGERIDKASGRIGKLRNNKNEEKGGEKLNQTEERLKERKAKFTERYNTFQKNIETRKTKAAEQFEKMKANLSARIDGMSAADKDRVTAAFDTMRSEVVAEATKLAGEAKTKIDATYKRIMEL